MTLNHITPAKYNFTENNKSGNNHPQPIITPPSTNTNSTHNMLNWLCNKENRKFLSWLGGGLVVIVIGLWAVYHYFGTNNMLNWLLKEENRKLISWIGGGLVVIVPGLWAVYTYFDRNNMLNWLRNKENREILSLVGGILVVIVSGLWAVHTHNDKPSQTSIPTPAPITTGDIHSDGDTVVGAGTIDKRTYNYSGVTDIELAKQLGVAEAAVKNFFKILDQKHTPIAEWDSTLRQLAERYKELQKRAALLESEDPEVQSLQDHAKQAIDAAEFAKAEALLAKAVDLDNAAAEKFKASFIQRKRSAAESQALKAKSLYTRFALPEAMESYQQAIELAKQGEDENKFADYQWGLGRVLADNASFEQAIASYENALNHYLALEGEDSTKVAALRNNLGIAWAEKGENDKAIAYYEKALRVWSDKLGNDHPHTKMARDNIEKAKQKIAERRKQ